MKHLFFIFSLLLILTNAFSQRPLNTDFPKFQLGINLSPDIGYRTYKDKGGGAALIQYLKDRETPKFGFTGGFNACYNHNSVIGFEAGLQYSNKGYQTVKMSLYFFPPSSTDPVSIRYLYSLHYIDIPLKANFTLGNRKVRFFGSAGFVTNVFIREKTTEWLEYKEPAETRKYEYINHIRSKRVRLSAMISAGISWQLNEKFTLRIEPTYRQDLPSSDGGPVKIYLCNPGLNLGLYYGL